VVIESFTTDVKVIARAAAIWRKIEPKRDDIAVRGLANLRRFFGKKASPTGKAAANSAKKGKR
jgi:D-psicose/D-tagatose/L-ribulose 3-epimerase